VGVKESSEGCQEKGCPALLGRGSNSSSRAGRRGKCRGAGEGQAGNLTQGGAVKRHAAAAPHLHPKVHAGLLQVHVQARDLGVAHALGHALHGTAPHSMAGQVVSSSRGTQHTASHQNLLCSARQQRGPLRSNWGRQAALKTSSE
jgi:hypothetical protein